jgi:hypothetical protein
MSHEDLSRDQLVEGSSDRSFGFVFTAFFLVVACWPLVHGEAPRWWMFSVAAVVMAAALLKPTLLAGFNRLWTKLGILLGNVISPIALGFLFYCIFAPIGALMRLCGNDPLRLKSDTSADSYWIPRDPPGPPPDSMTNQF